ncbi:hypothetical protein TRFO_29229 [Tritrichomonas foetus]|uniref:Uncharacterized protein n=1 Tax=Tritrichomonas foetus TaxID=1144522 RepID=A0A1J4JY36_9EUKA|nr:hypothetical protein TRFO_29229 [Tritrichomonas foetus]|eukprot:OHT03368.1 hypothetical protein TRFO_29229 [Tritrichomonas foetus]
MGSIIKETHENKEKDGASLNNALDNFTSALTGDQNQDDTSDKQDDQIEEKQVKNESNEIDNKLERGLMGNIIKDAYANKENDENINDEVEKSDTDFVGESDFEKDSSAVENSNQEENDAEEKKESPKIEAGLFGNILADAHANKVEDEQTEEPIPESSNNESTDKEAASNNESEKKEESPKLQAGIFGNIVAEAHANKVEDEPQAEENNDETTSETVTRESNEDSSKEDNQAKDDSPKLGAGLMGNIIADAYANKAQDESNANDSAVENERSTTDDNSTNNKKEDDQNNRGDGKLDNAMNSVAGGLLG